MSGSTAFRDRDFGRRYQQMGDQAEGVCAQVLDGLGVRYTRTGFSRPPFSIEKLPPLLRYLPDYSTADRLIECQGFGRDGKVKVKRDKLEALTQWHQHQPVELFLWWSTRRKWALVPLPDVCAAVDDPERSELGFFDGSKAYFAVHGDALTDAWQKLEAVGA